MKIKEVIINNRKKSFEITVGQKKPVLEFPFARLRTKPKGGNNLIKAIADPELGCQAITYTLSNGSEDVLTLDEILSYNNDPEYRRQMHLYELTLKAHKILEQSKLSHRAVIRRMKSSPTQFYRLLDTTHYSKTLDQMICLLEALDYDVDFRIHKKAA